MVEKKKIMAMQPPLGSPEGSWWVEVIKDNRLQVYWIPKPKESEAVVRPLSEKESRPGREL